MPANALALVLAAALLHAFWNFAAKKAGGNHHFALASALTVSVIWLPVVWVVGWDVVAAFDAKIWAVLLATAILHLLYFNALLTGYRVADLSVVYPIARGSAPAMSAIAALLLLDEHLGLRGSLGLLAVVLGIVLIAAGPGLWRRSVGEAQRRRKLGLLWGGLIGVLIAGYTVVDGYAIKVLLISPLLLDYFSNLLRVPFMLPALWRDPEGFAGALRLQWRYVLLVAVCSPLAYILVLYAMQLAPLSRVAPTREVSMLFAALLGGTLLKEGERGWRLAGAACIAAGVIGLTL
ncbi:EamA family transporter [Paucibacter sp. KBW04]|uniref:EamA family transporter n=1 Tax=Paucibacter sp. KBW04 TaxID=2153361 RepID=UPI000F5735D5|nr:EamA family transporter [Paucibacter sp. KBW04]RQO63217.1 EamA family transporter [Paucibacter sp. KBW04]